MKKILTAMGNVNLNRELMRFSKYDLKEDLYYQEAVIDILLEEKYDVFIVSSLLQGQLEFFEFIEKVRRIDSIMRIIIVSDEIDDVFKRKMSDFNIIDVFIDSTVTIDDIVDSIDREEPLKNKYISNTKVAEIKQEYMSDLNKENSINSVILEKVTQKQEVIVVNGINGSGKSTIASNISKYLARKTDSKILLIDLDTLNGNLDEVLDIHKVPQNVEILIDNDKKCGLNYAVELITKNRFDINVFDELVIKEEGIEILTGNTSLYYCQNVLNEEHYEIILNCAKEKYDFIVIDTSSNVFLDSTKWALQQATKVFFVTENNYLSMKKSAQLIEVYTNNWKIWKNKINIIINKFRKTGIEVEVVQKIFSDYKVIGKIKNEEENDENAYLKILEMIKFVPKKTFVSKILSNKFLESKVSEPELLKVKSKVM